jgi:tripartite-type tricarboxylate transporter receptor subunit TctC
MTRFCILLGLVCTTFASFGGALSARPAQAAWPDRPITMVVPYAPGGSADVVARVMAPEMASLLGQPVVVELRPGAGGNIGAAHVASSARADGYTVLLGSVSLAIGPAISTLSFDPIHDLVPIGGIGAVPNLAVVAPASPFHSITDLLAAARARPGTVSYGSSGLGTGSHLAGELLAASAGVELLHVPYRGSGAVYPDLMAQRISLLLDGMGSAIGQVQSGAVRAIGISSSARSDILPDVPTIAEQGVPGFEMSLWLGFFVRSGTPPEAMAKLEAAHRRALHAPQVQERLRQAAAQPIPEDAIGFASYFRANAALWADLAARGKLQRID